MRHWFWDGTYIDYGSPVESCELCGKQGLRYHFPIINSINEEIKHIGSECILKFDVSAKAQDGTFLNKREIRDKINHTRNEITKRNKMNHILSTLGELLKKEEALQTLLTGCIDYYMDNGYFTPKQLFTIQWRFEKYGIEHKKSYFPLSIKNKKYQEQIEAMEDWKVKKLKPYMTSPQRERFGLK